MPEDYSFMKSGRSLLVEPEKKIELSGEEIDNIYAMITLFTENALVNACNYVKLCGRNGVTKKDIKHGLIFEVFEFMKRENLSESIKETLEELEQICEDDGDSEWEDIDEDLITNDEKSIDTYSRVDLDNVDDKDKEFVMKYNEHVDNWVDWKPSNKLEDILYNAINNKVFSSLNSFFILLK